MIYSIRAIIREFVAPKHRIRCSKRRWNSIIHQLNIRGEGRHEAGVFLLGREIEGRREVRNSVFYDELDPNAYSTGVCVLHGDAFAKLWRLCRAKGLTVVADVHTHGGAAIQSGSDRTNPMVAREGHVAIIVPNLARSRVHHAKLGVYEYRGNHEWHNFSGIPARNFFYVGFWS